MPLGGHTSYAVASDPSLLRTATNDTAAAIALIGDSRGDVAGSHLGIAFDRKAYRAIAEALTHVADGSPR